GRNERRRQRPAPRRAGRDGAAASPRRLARGRHRQRLALRRQSLGFVIAARRGRAPRRPPRRLRNARAAGLIKGARRRGIFSASFVPAAIGRETVDPLISRPPALAFSLLLPPVLELVCLAAPTRQSAVE